jgi:hypothetical protein
VVYPDDAADLAGQDNVLITYACIISAAGITVISPSIAGITTTSVLSGGIFSRIDITELARAAPESQCCQEHEKYRFHRCKS